MKRKNWIWIIVIVIAVLVGYKLYTNKRKINEINTQDSTQHVGIKIPVVVDTVKLQAFNGALKKTGNLAPYKEATIYAASAGTVEQLHFELGDRVAAGQLLAVIDTKKLTIDLQNAVARERKLQNDVQTYKELLEGKATTQEKVNELQLDLTDARNETAQIRKQLNDTKILAPISGVVTEKSVERGVFLTSAAELGKIVNLSTAKVEVYMTESEVYNISENDNVTITSDVYPGKMFKGLITYISPQADATHSYLTQIEFNNTNESPLRSGTFVYVTFQGKQDKPVLVLSREALLENTSEPTIYVVNGNKTVLRKIETGRDMGDQVEVLSGVSEGEIVVKSGQINLKNNTEISISNKKKN